MSKYLLPCSNCGEKLMIDVSQAGQSISCKCGSQTEVPTLRGLQKLERVEGARAPEDTEPAWSQQQGIMFSTGLALIVVGAGLCTYLLWERSKLDTARPIDRLRFREEKAIDGMSPLQVWQIWVQMRDYRLSQDETPQYQLNRQRAQQLLIIASISGGAAIVGLGLLLSSFIVRPKTAPKRKRRKPAKAGP
jgi:hypothetical protein